MLDLRQCALGIEFGSTRIKAVLVDGSHAPVAQGDFTWENQLKDGVWTYPLEAVHTGLGHAYPAPGPASRWPLMCRQNTGSPLQRWAASGSLQ